jgi:hypothetical protein
MTAATTTASDTLARLDDGSLLPGDRAVIEVFERHLQWGAQRFCLVCGEPGGPECDSCHSAHDRTITRLTDI